MDTGSMGALPYTCCGKKRLGAWTVRQEQKPYTPTWCVCHLGIVRLLLDHTLEITHLCVWMRQLACMCFHVHTNTHRSLRMVLQQGNERSGRETGTFSVTHTSHGVGVVSVSVCLWKWETVNKGNYEQTPPTGVKTRLLIYLEIDRSAYTHTHTSRVIFSYTPSLPNTSFWWSLGSRLQSMSTDFLFFL